MSHRPLNKKRAARVRKALRRTPAASLDIVQWLKDRRYAQTTGEAERIILAKRVRSESHPLGIAKEQRPKPSARARLEAGLPLSKDDFEEVDVVQRLVPAKLRGSITVA